LDHYKELDRTIAPEEIPSLLAYNQKLRDPKIVASAFSNFF